MPVYHHVDNALELIMVRFSDNVTERQISELIDGLSREVRQGGNYRSLLIFERKTDLSELDHQALEKIKEEMKGLHRDRQMGRRASAAVLDSSHDAIIILPLWNALCAEDTELDLHYDTFKRLAPALNWLEVPEEEGLAIAKRTGFKDGDYLG